MSPRVFRTDELFYEDRGWTRGFAHLSFDDVPRQAPGYLDLGPVPLVVVQQIDAGAGYPMHHHENVQTLTVVLDGALNHEDSLGNRVDVGAGELALLTAGAGMSHAEMTGPAGGRAFMFWLRQREPGGDAGFVRGVVPTLPTSGFVTLASGRPGAPAGALPLLNDAALDWAVLGAGEAAHFSVEAGRRAYLVAPDAAIDLDGTRVEAGGRALVDGPAALTIRAECATPVALLDLAGFARPATAG